MDVRALILAVTALVLAAAPAAAQWAPPVTVAQEATGSEFGTVFQSVQVGIDDAGNGVVVWQRVADGQRFTNDRIFAADVRADGTTTAPVRISPPGVRAYTPVLDVAPDGHAAVIFDTGAPRSISPQIKRGASRAVRLVTRAPGGDWSRPRALSTGGHNYAGDVVVEPSGTVVAAWKHLRGRIPNVVLARVTGTTIRRSRLPDSTTKPRLAASEAFPDAALAYLVNKGGVNGGPRELHLRVDGHDRVLDELQDRDAPSIAAGEHLDVAWGWYTLEESVPLDQRNGLRVARLEPGADQPVVQTFDTSTGGVGGPTVATSGSTDALDWMFGFDTHTSRADAGAPFAPGAALSPTTPVTVGETATGAGRVVTTGTVDSHQVGGRNPLVAAVSDPGGPFGAPVDLLGADESLDAPGWNSLTMNRSGEALIAYRVSTVGHADIFGATLKVARLPAAQR